MKNGIFKGEVVMSIILILLLILFLNPTNLLMPETFVMMLEIGIVIAFLLFSGFIWKEKALDERDNYHRMHAGRISFFTGTTILIIGIVLQGLKHEIDPWLIYSLIGMVLAKIVSRIYSELRQ